MVGGAPPKEVEMALCDIGTVFLHLTEIKSNSDCTAGCAGGTGECGDISQWYPGRADLCSAECGVVFEPFCAPDSSAPSPAPKRSHTWPVRRGPVRPDARRLRDGRHGRDVSLL